MENRILEEREDWWRGAEVVQLVGDSAYGGGVPVILGIMEACSRIGLRPVLLASNPDVVSAARAAGMDVWVFGGIVRRPRPLRDLAAAVRLAVALRKRAVRIVHTHTSKGGMVGRLGAWLAGCELVIHHTHGFYHLGLPSGLRRWAMEWLERVFAALGDYQIFLTAAEAGLAIERRIVPATKARVIPNGIRDPREHGLASRHDLLLEWGLPIGCTLVGTVARLNIRQKGLDTGLLAFSEVAKALPDAHYVVVGKGEDEMRLRQIAEELQITDRVHFVGHRDDALVLPYVFDVCFYPSVREGQSIAVLEAMAWGRPIVATRIIGTDGLVEHGRNALICEPSDAHEMAEAIVELMRDTALAASLGEGARLTYESSYTWDSFLSRVVDVYLDMLTRAGPDSTP